MTEHSKADSLVAQPSDQSLTRFQERAPQLLQQVREISVLDDAAYLQVCEYKLAGAAILRTLTTITNQIKHTHKAALESAITPWERIMKPLEEAVALAEQKRKEYRAAQEARTAAAAAEAMALQRERIAEQQRQNAAMLDAAGHAAAAEAVRAATPLVPPIVLPPAVPKVRGIRNAKTWKVRVTDQKLLVRAIGAALILASDDLALDDFTKNILHILSGGVTVEALTCLFDAHGETANMHWLRDRARMQREAFKMPGVGAWQD